MIDSSMLEAIVSRHGNTTVTSNDMYYQTYRATMIKSREYIFDELRIPSDELLSTL